MHHAGNIPRHAVNSTTIRSVGYDEADWVLQVERADGKVYNYYRVPPEEYAKLAKASSADAWLRREIQRYYESDEAVAEV